MEIADSGYPQLEATVMPDTSAPEQLGAPIAVRFRAGPCAPCGGWEGQERVDTRMSLRDWDRHVASGPHIYAVMQADAQAAIDAAAAERPAWMLPGSLSEVVDTIDGDPGL
jgi:hypothetical protein